MFIPVYTAAIQLAMAMDPEADPCQDFFQYACGNWNRNNPIPKSKSTWSQFDNLNEQLFNVLKGDIYLQLIWDNLFQQVLQKYAEILEDTNAITDPLPLKMSRQMYIACMDTGRHKSFLIVFKNGHYFNNTSRNSRSARFNIFDRLSWSLRWLAHDVG